jgi:carboxyl-terminal processing protease
MRKLPLLMIGALVGASMATLVSQTHVLTSTNAIAASAETYRQLSLFGDVFERVRQDYVEAPDEAAMIEAAINGMLSSLDPHSGFMDAKSHRDMQQQTRGEFGGLGIEVTMDEGLVRVVAPIDETPAFEAGVMANDLITHIDGEQVDGMTLSQAVDMMRGAVGTEVTLRIRRSGAADPVEITIVRDIIRVRPVRARLEDDIGYLRVTTFNGQTESALRRAVRELKEEAGPDGLKGFVVDMRNNPGGLLDQGVRVTDAFLDRGEIVSIRGRDTDRTQRISANSGDISDGLPIVVLINGGSASASEIFAGALQDHERATLMGTRSFGKGSVQTIIPLNGNGALRLTTSRYYTPSGRSIQARGIDPDILVLQDVPEELRGQDETTGEAGLRGHLSGEEEETGGSSAYIPPDPEDDKQLLAALAFLRGQQIDSFLKSEVETENETVPN